MIIAVLQTIHLALALALSLNSHYLPPIQDFRHLSFSSPSHLNRHELKRIKQPLLPTSMTFSLTLLGQMSHRERINIIPSSKNQVSSSDSRHSLVSMQPQIEIPIMRLVQRPLNIISISLLGTFIQHMRGPNGAHIPVLSYQHPPLLIYCSGHSLIVRNRE